MAWRYLVSIRRTLSLTVYNRSYHLQGFKMDPKSSKILNPQTDVDLSSETVSKLDVIDQESANVDVGDSSPACLGSSPAPLESPPLSGTDSEPECSSVSKFSPSMSSRYRIGFTSEIFKIEIFNTPPYVGFKQMRSRLKNNMKLKPVKVKLIRSMCFATFACEEDRQEALRVINGHVWKKNILKATLAKPSVDPILKRKRQLKQATDEDGAFKKPCTDARSLDDRLKQAITPLLDLPYEDQLSQKTTDIKKILANVAQLLIRKSKAGKWFTDHVASSDGLLCNLDPIKPSPVVTEYRNKCEFTIGLGPTNNSVVGFRIGAYRDGDLTVAPPNSCIVPAKTRKIVDVIQEVVQESSLRPYDCHTYDGYWKQVAIRCFTTGETMIVVQFNPQELSQVVIDKEKQLLVDTFKRAPPDVIPTSLYWQTVQPRGSSSSGLEFLLGEEYVHEEVLGVRFRISPDSFFQVNSKATEVLYSTIGELIANEGEAPVIYDLCCGTGTIGITLSKITNVSKVVGIELIQQAVTDARFNATSNGLENAEFICGKVEDTLSSVIGKEKTKDSIIAIADPPRGGLHSSVIQAIRRCPLIDTLIYVSCNPDGITSNINEPNSNKIKGLPFCPVKAVPVDLFPQTRHCELVLVFKRIHPTASVSGNKVNDEEIN